MIQSWQGVVPPAQAGERLDRGLAALTGQSRAAVRRIVELGGAWVDGQRLRVLGRSLRAGQRLELHWAEPPEDAVADLDAAALLARGRAVLAVNKPAGVHCQGARHRWVGTLPELVARATGSSRAPEPVHRLDREASGVVLLAEAAAAVRTLSEHWRRRSVRKLYLGVARGGPRDEQGIIDLPLAERAGGGSRAVPAGRGQAAQSRYRVLSRSAEACLLLLEPVTGRKHQLRVHCAALGFPLAGDRRYGARDEAPRLGLHAWVLGLPEPRLGLPPLLVAPCPQELAELASGWGLRLPSASDIEALLGE